MGRVQGPGATGTASNRTSPSHTPQRCTAACLTHLPVVLFALLCRAVPCCLQLSAAAAYFGLDDYQKDTVLGGYIMAAFFAVGAPAALLCGYFADKFNRVHMLAFIIVLGEAPCLCTYWVSGAGYGWDTWWRNV